MGDTIAFHGNFNALLSFLIETSGVWGAVLGAGVGVFSSSLLRYSGPVEIYLEGKSLGGEPISKVYPSKLSEEERKPKNLSQIHIYASVDFYNGQEISANIRRLQLELRRQGEVIRTFTPRTSNTSEGEQYTTVHIPPNRIVNKDLRLNIYVKNDDELEIKSGDTICLSGHIPRTWKTFWKKNKIDVELESF